MTRKVHEVFSGHFECRHCELDVPATVGAVGWGEDTGAPPEAGVTAVEDASGVASRTLQFVKCPRCGKLDPGGRSYRVQVTVGSLLIAALAVGVTFALVAAKRRNPLDRDETWGLALFLGALIGGVFYWNWGRPWRGAARRTRIQYAGDGTARRRADV